MATKIAHLSDIQVRWGERHQEYATVFARTIEDLKKVKPDRIAILGDIFHHKVKLSPTQLMLVSDFFFDLADIAPTDVILGNHDLNLKHLDQGDALTPIFGLAKKLGKEDKAIVVTPENKHKIDFSKKAVYYYPDSDFYQISDDIVYGVFSCKDNKMLKWESPAHPDITYIALWHGTLYGAKMDNGYEANSGDMVNLSTFEDFDITMMGDIHEYQTFDKLHHVKISEEYVEDYKKRGWEVVEETSEQGYYMVKKRFESVVYSGSLLQQNFGESITKGYCLWEFDKKEVSHSRRIVLNDYGFAKIDISRGENIEERINNIQFSNNKRKTKIHVTYEDYEENYSIEKLQQIKQLIKDKYGCETIKVFFKEMPKSVLESKEEPEHDLDPQNFEKMFSLFLEENEFDIKDDEEKEEIIKFALQLEKEINIPEPYKGASNYDILDVEISNVFSFPVEPVRIPMELLQGITGVFGENFCGKSNTFKAIVWGLFQKIMGNAHPQYLVNIYTEKDKGYVKITLNIDGVKYRILREVHKTKTGNSYPTKFEVFRELKNEQGEMEFQWKQTLSDNDTADNNEVKNMIAKAIGSYDDFAKISIHAQDERDGYLNLEQQEKNDLIGRYLDLQPYRERNEYAKKPFNELRNKQKLLGEAVEIETVLKDIDISISEKNKTIESIGEEIKLLTLKKEDQEKKMLEAAKQIKQVENIGFTSKDDISSLLESKENDLKKLIKESSDIEEWLSKNIKKELQIDVSRNISVVTQELNNVRDIFNKEKTKFVDIEKWVSTNSLKDVPDINVEEIRKTIEDYTINLTNCKNKKLAFQGKRCPTCNQVTLKAEPEKEVEMDKLISETGLLIEKHKKAITEYDALNEWNKSVNANILVFENLKNSLSSRKTILDNLKRELDNLEKNKEFIEQNTLIDIKTNQLKSYLNNIAIKEKEIITLKDKLTQFDSIKLTIDQNKKIESLIEEIQSIVKEYKLSIYNCQKQETNAVADLRLLTSKKEEKEKTLVDVKNSDKTYKKYSIYLQAVDRNGIPAMVIRKKLPLINNRINGILQSVVEFKVEFSIDMKGNITELLFNTENKTDGLPLVTASGSQKFIVSLAIKDALNYISKKAVVQPSIIMIDEGFGTLDDHFRVEILGTLQYLKTRYKNVMMITHLNEVKEGADHLIEITRDRSFLGDIKDFHDNKVGITLLSVKR